MPDAVISVALQADSAQFEKTLSRAAIMAEKFESDLRKQNTGRTSGVGLPGLELTPQSLRQLETAAARSQDLARKTAMAGQSGKAGALGFLAFSQAVEDAQYGIAGVLNNIPQMIIGFGGGAGLAGALSLTAVAAYGAYKAIKQLSGLDEAIAQAKALTDAEDAFTAALKKNRQAREDRANASAVSNKIDMKNFDESSRIDAATKINEDLIRSLDQRMEAIKRARAVQDALIGSASGAKPANESAKDQGQRETGKAVADYLREQKRLNEDITAQLEYENALGKEWSRIRRESVETDQRLTAEAANLSGPLEEARQKAQDFQATLARVESRNQNASKDSPTYKINEKEISYLKDRIREQNTLADGLEKEKSAIEELIKKTVEQAQASMKALDAKRQASKEAVDLTREEIKNLAAKYSLEGNLIRLRSLQGQGAELKTSADKAAASAETVQSMVDEINLIDEAVQKGGEKLKNLEREKQIREDMNKLMAQGINAIDAQILAEKRAASRDALQKAQAAQAGGTISERAKIRADQRAAERQEERDKRVAEAAAKRAEAREKRKAEEERRFPKKEKDPGIKAKEQADQIAKDAQKRAEEAAKARDENIKTQTELQRGIKEYLEKLGAA